MVMAKAHVVSSIRRCILCILYFSATKKGWNFRGKSKDAKDATFRVRPNVPRTGGSGSDKKPEAL